MANYRKIKGTGIFDGHTLLGPEYMLVIEENGTVEGVVTYTEGGDVEEFEGLITPGFINCHCHLELSHLKGKIEEGTELVEFVQQVMAKRDAPAEEKLQAIKDAHVEMELNGIVAVGDICNTADTVPIKEMSEVFYRNFIEVSGFIGSVAGKRMDAARQVQKLFIDKKLNGAIVPHAPYSVSKELFELIAVSADGGIISIHNQENADEDYLYMEKTGAFLSLFQNMGLDISGFKESGQSSFTTWKNYFNTSTQILSVHNTFINETDLKEDNKNIHFCLCPNANLYIENKLPPVDMLMKYSGNIVLGTDSLASNHQLCILSEMKTIMEHFPQIELETLLQWATINGARALGIDHTFGSFEKGKKPGVNYIQNNSAMVIT